jgi:hypothetical protein
MLVCMKYVVQFFVNLSAISTEIFRGFTVFVERKHQKNAFEVFENSNFLRIRFLLSSSLWLKESR